jgi:hypothetical protein
MDGGIMGDIPLGTEVGRPVSRDPFAVFEFETGERWKYLCIEARARYYRMQTTKRTFSTAAD